MTRLAVLKLGGSSALEAAPDVASYARERAVVVVHGGGPQISAIMRARGVEPRFAGGRRMTDGPVLECVEEGLRLVSRELCAALAEAGLEPRPLIGGIVQALRVPGLGLVGTPVRADVPALEAVLAAGCVPVIAPLAAELDGGGLLNVNADDAAACIAAALGADELVFVTDVPGVLDEDGELIPAIAASSPPPSASGGMLPKLEACAAAVRAGVGQVTIGLGGTVVGP